MIDGSGHVPTGGEYPAGIIWIVEDSASQLNRTRRLLSSRYSVESFLEGAGMIERLSRGEGPDALVLDWQLPGLSGVEVCKFVREQHDEVSLPILMLSSRDAKSDFAEGLAVGANDYVTKPYDDAELLARLATLVRVRQSHKRLGSALDALKRSEERLRLVAEAAGTSAWELDPRTGLVTVDGPIREPHGFPERDGFSLDRGISAIHPEDRERVQQAVQAALSGHRAGRYQIEYRVIGRHGRPGWVEARGQAYFDHAGKPTRFLGTAMDVTARKEAEVASAEASARALAAVQAEDEIRRTLEAVVEGSQDYIGLATPDGKVLYVNAAGRRMVGLDNDEEARSVRLHEFFTADAFARVQEEAMPAMLAAGTWAGETSLRHFKTGEAIPVHQYCMGLVDSAGKVVRLATITRDLREVKRLEEEARERAAFEQHLIGIVSHDLRNPVNVVTLSAAMLLRGTGLDEKLHKPIGRILSAGERAGRLIRDLLDFTQARLGGGLPVRAVPLDFHDVTRRVVEEFQISNPSRELRAEYRGDGKGTGDEDRIAQLLGNLLSNAIQYSPPGSPIEVRTLSERDEVVLEVHNGGAPIPEAMLDLLFEPLKRGPGDGSNEGRSIGLGLYIVNYIVKAHQGSIGVRSNAADGTTFTVRLPRG